VRLLFVDAPDQPSLYCHTLFLNHYFGVFKDMPELANVPTHSSSSTEGAYYTLPLDDNSCTAFEDALSFMCPEPPLPSITWDNVEGLLLLADKYNSPYFMGETVRGRGHA
jgi:hypothetical protein